MKDLNARAFAWRGIVAAVVGGSVMFGSSMVARADDVTHEILNVDATVTTMNLTAGGATGSAELSIKSTGGDGKPGCNLTGSTTLGVAVNSSNAAVATVSPNSVTFESCGDVKTLTVTPVGGGTAAISLSQTSNNTGATFNLVPATFTVNVTATPPSNTPPTVRIDGVNAGATYEHGAIPAATCSVTDAQDGNSNVAATLGSISGPLAGFGLGSQTANCSYTDHGGLTATASAAYTIVDTGKPVIELKSRTPGVNANGWNNTDVTVEWSCNDAVSGVAASTITANVMVEGANQDATGICKDGAGNTASASEKVSIDRNAPTIAFKSRTPAGPGWSTENVVVTWTCTDALSGVVDATVSKTIDADGADQSATGTCTDKAGNTSTSAPVGDIDVDRTPPTIALKFRTDANGNDWNKTNVTVVWDCTDAASGVVENTVTETLGTEGENQSLTGTCTNGAGLTASATETHINIDKTAPVTTFVSRNPEGDGWTNKDVVVTWTCTDGGSGVVSKTVSDTITAEGNDHTATGTCEDLAGNTFTGAVSGIKVDKTPPTIKYESRSATGWINEPVTVTWSCADEGGSGVAATVSETVSTAGADQKVTGTCTDGAGNEASDTVEDIDIDLTKPTITWNGGPGADSTSIFGSVPAKPTCNAVDSLSGPRDCVVTGYEPRVGHHTMTGTATDKAGNETTETRTYTVTAWTLKGFYQPVNMGDVWNTVKAGSTVPLKFEVFAGGTELTDPAAIEKFTVKAVSCSGASALTDEIEFITTGGTSLRYSDGQFIQNWQTPKGAVGCYLVTMTTDDNSAISAQFKLK